MENAFDILFGNYAPELYWDEVIVSDTKEYVVLIYDVAKVETTQKFSGGYWYLVFKCKLIKGFEETNINLDQTYQFHFPAKSFNMAWRIAENWKNVLKSDNFDCLIKFKRLSVKKIRIIKRKFLPIAKYDTEEEINQFIGDDNEMYVSK